MIYHKHRYGKAQLEPAEYRVHHGKRCLHSPTCCAGAADDREGWSSCDLRFRVVTEPWEFVRETAESSGELLLLFRLTLFTLFHQYGATNPPRILEELVCYRGMHA